MIHTDDDTPDNADRMVLFLLVLFTLIVDGCGAAFIYKVWNERQMTREYRGQRIAQERIAVVLERTYPPKQLKRDPHQWRSIDGAVNTISERPALGCAAWEVR